jgi:hypothetical protein
MGANRVIARPGIAFLASALVLFSSVAAGCGSGGANKAGGGSQARHETLRLHTGAGAGGYFPIRTSQKPPGGGRAGFTRTDPLYDSSGARAGAEDVMCLSGGIARRAICSTTLSLTRGTVVAEGVFTGGSYGGKLAVTGGTGKYEGARGTFETTAPGPEPILIVVHLLLP